MSIATDICAKLRAVSACHLLDDGTVLVNTHCMYPSNGVVQVSVRGTPAGFVVSDDGGAMREVVNAGAEIGAKPDDKYARIAAAQGLIFYSGIVQAPIVPIESIALAIILVANASKEIADAYFAQWKPKKERNFKRLVHELLASELNVNPRQETLYGKTNKPHKFDNVFDLPGGKRAVVDAVLNDVNSINSRVVANLDIKSNDASTPLKQAIIYDDELPWKQNDLNVLHLADVSMVPFSSAAPALRQLLRA